MWELLLPFLPKPHKKIKIQDEQRIQKRMHSPNCMIKVLVRMEQIQAQASFFGGSCSCEKNNWGKSTEVVLQVGPKRSVEQ